MTKEETMNIIEKIAIRTHDILYRDPDVPQSLKKELLLQDIKIIISAYLKACKEFEAKEFEAEMPNHTKPRWQKYMGVNPFYFG